MDDALLERAATRFGTPSYLYDLDAIATQVGALRAELPEALLRYAVKANPCGQVLRRLAALGVGAEVITLGELERALLAGMPADSLLLGGPRQDPALVNRALEAGVRLVSLDGPGQLSTWSRAGCQGVRFLVRLNPGLDPRTHPHMATGAPDSKFGLPFAEARELATTLAADGRLAGFHVHAGSQITDLEVYEDIFTQLERLYGALGPLEMLDLGGGFAVPGFPLHGFAARVRTFVRTLNARLLLEPGRFLVARAGVLLTRVLHVKDGSRRHVITDAGMAELLRPALYGATHPIRVVGRTGTGIATGPADVDGPLCENADRLGRDILLPAVAPGDLLVVEQAGAYGYAMASNYASSLRPAEAVVTGGELRLARARETVAELVRLEEP